MIPCVAVAISYDPRIDPALQPEVVTPYPVLRLVLLRSVAILAIALPAVALAGLLVPGWAPSICLAAAIPPLCGGLSLLAIGVFQQVPGDWSYGSLGTSNLFAVVLSQTVLPALGGPLLGVALARWVRFPGAAAVLFLVLYGWVTLTYTLAAAHRHSTLIVMLRFFAPFAFFTTRTARAGSRRGGARPGSSWAGSCACVRSR